MSARPASSRAEPQPRAGHELLAGQDGPGDRGRGHRHRVRHRAALRGGRARGRDQRPARAAARRGGQELAASTGQEAAGDRLRRDRPGAGRRHLFDTVAAELGRLDVLVNNVGPRRRRRAGRHDRRAVEHGARRDAERHVPVHPGRPAAHVPRGRGVIVNNASVLGWRAQAGQAHYAAAKAGRHGAHPVRGDRGGPARRPGQRGGAEHRDAPLPGQGHHARSCSPSWPRGRRSAGPPSRGRSPTSSCSSPATTPPT